MISNKIFINCKVLDLVELYNFDIRFVFIQLHLKKRYEFICVAAIFKAISENHSFSETVDISNRP